MAGPTKTTLAALGFRVKSGWAAAVLLDGPVDALRVLDCRRIELSDPALPETRQPYHADFGTHEEDSAKIERRTRAIQSAAARSVAQLLRSCADRGCSIAAAGLVVGSQVDPASIANPHIRAHASEGRLFRTVLADALRSRGVAGFVIVERRAYENAARVLKRDEAELKQVLSSLGRRLGIPWRADEKLAALAAWLALAGNR